MRVAKHIGQRDLANLFDQRVVLHDVSWREFERILAARGDAAGPRLTYLEGELELMSPSIQHEGIKSLIGRLVEAYADHLDVDLNAYGSWTLKKASRARGIEPDECYVVGDRANPRAPDLAIEVAWTSWSIDKLEVYRGLGVREVWVWEDGRIRVNVLRGGRYVHAPRSGVLPQIDLPLVAKLATHQNQSRAVRALRQQLGRRRPSR